MVAVLNKLKNSSMTTNQTCDAKQAYFKPCRFRQKNRANPSVFLQIKT